MEVDIEEIVSKKLDFDKIEIVLNLNIFENDYLIIERLIKRIKFTL